MKHFAYAAYLLRHKSRVFAHSLILGVPIRGLLHDMSKLHPLEWKGIGRQFYPGSQAEKDGNAGLFTQAKEHHRRRNLHEVDHWYRDDGTCEAIPGAILREVMADWAAFGGLCFNKVAVREHARRCYEKWGRNYRMHKDSRAWIEDFLRIKDTRHDTSR